MSDFFIASPQEVFNNVELHLVLDQIVIIAISIGLPSFQEVYRDGYRDGYRDAVLVDIGESLVAVLPVPVGLILGDPIVIACCLVSKNN